MPGGLRAESLAVKAGCALRAAGAVFLPAAGTVSPSRRARRLPSKVAPESFCK